MPTDLKGLVLGPSGEILNLKPEAGVPAFEFPFKEDLPPGWQASVHVEQLTAAYKNDKKNLRVLLSISPKGEYDDPWIHLSVSKPSATPNHDQMMLCKRLFIGDAREAISIYPPKNRWVNTHQNCLHLWSPLDPRCRTWPKMEFMDDAGSLQI